MRLDRPTFMMCPPDYFRITYAINQHMLQGRQAWAANPVVMQKLAKHQWMTLKKTLEDLGARIILLPPDARYPDQVFSADSAIALTHLGRRRALLSRFRFNERKGEDAPIAQHYRRLRFEVQYSEAPLEGTGDCIWDTRRRLFWAGVGVRTSLAAHQTMRDFFGVPVVSLRLNDGDGNRESLFFHLDTCFCPLPQGEIVLFEPALHASALAAIAERVPDDLWLRVTAVDAAKMACNMVALGRHLLVSNDLSLGLTKQLRARGYILHPLDLSVFQLAGGAMHCLTQPVHYTLG